VVFDLIGGDYGPRSLETLRPGGLLVSAGLANPGVTAADADAHGLRVATVGVSSSGADLERLARMVDEGSLTVHVEQTLPLEQAARPMSSAKPGE